MTGPEHYKKAEELAERGAKEEPIAVAEASATALVAAHAHPAVGYNYAEVVAWENVATQAGS
jgi:hypothetical protein